MSMQCNCTAAWVAAPCADRLPLLDWQVVRAAKAVTSSYRAVQLLLLLLLLLLGPHETVCNNVACKER